ncbi:MAG: YcjF family protein, partial [Anaerolineae bacterium]|nr:YcjF family protein [Anaerolineae bacterium]
MSNYNDKANAVIATAVVTTATMGGVPIIISITPLVAANGIMVGSLAMVYGIPWSDNNTQKLINTLLRGAAIQSATIVSMNVLWEAIRFTGIGFGAAMAANAVTNALVTLAIGRAAKLYFEHNCDISDAQVAEEFANTITLGSL